MPRFRSDTDLLPTGGNGDSHVTNGAATPIERMANASMLTNQDWVMQSLWIPRLMWLDQLIDFKHNIDLECGYPPDMTPFQYRRLYDRESIPQRVVNILPDESWSSTPTIRESENPNVNTEFDDAIEALTSTIINEDPESYVNEEGEQVYYNLSDEGGNIWSYLHRIDTLSRIGFYGLLLIGLNDGEQLWKPVEGINERGEVIGKPPKRKINFLRVFDETLTRVQMYNRDELNPRFTRPTYYTIRLVDLTQGNPEAMLVPGNYYQRVHWTRVCHVADNRKSSEVFGDPAQRPHLNRLLDLRKLYGASAEMFWKGGFPGLSFEIDPDVAAEPEMDQNQIEALRQEMSRYSEGLSRYLAFVGIKVNSLAPQIARPEKHIEEQLKAISIGMGIPFRIFLGSEEGKLASSQDKRTWNERLTMRRNMYLTPYVIRPFIDRLIAFGVLPRPKKYRVEWPDLNKPTDQDKANLGITRTQSLVQYFAARVFYMVTPKEFFVEFLGMDPGKATAILEASGISDKNGKVNMDRLEQVAAMLDQPVGGKDGGGDKNKAQSSVDASKNVSRGIKEASGGQVVG